MASIYDEPYRSQLNDYTIKLLSHLVNSKYVSNESMQQFIKQHIDSTGGFAPGADMKQKHQKLNKELEYIKLDDREYYYCSDDATVYSYEVKPKRIGRLDPNTLSIVCI